MVMIGFATLSGQASVSAQTPVQIGIDIHRHGANAADLNRQFDVMAAMKMTWVRFDIDWSVIETDKGKYNWIDADAIIEQSRLHGMNMLAVLAYTPPWAAAPAGSHSSHSSHSRPTNMSDYANFVRRAVERYAPRGVHSWEIWNEPNTGQFWPPRPDANEYGAMFRVAAQTIRSVDPAATVLIGGLARQPDAPSPGTAPTTYLEQLYSNGSARLADGVAAHPYSFPSYPMDPNGQAPGGFMDLPALHAVMDRHGDGRKKIWLTEFGAPTGTASNAVSEKTQAEILLQARQQVGRWDWAGPLFYYELIDYGTDSADKEQNFGLLRTDFTCKPAALALLEVRSC